MYKFGVWGLGFNKFGGLGCREPWSPSWNRVIVVCLYEYIHIGLGL